MKLPATRRNALCMTLCWFAFSMGYFGLVYNTPAFDWNIYLVFVFPTFFMIPVSLSQPFMENKLGRKPVMTSTMVLAGLCLLLTSGVPKGIIVIILGNYSKKIYVHTKMKLIALSQMYRSKRHIYMKFQKKKTPYKINWMKKLFNTKIWNQNIGMKGVN